jgi:excisionase family DNA binding protein
VPIRQTPDDVDLQLPRPFDGRLAASINETAEALNVDRDTIYRLVADGRLVMSKIGRRSIIHTASIQRLLQDTIVTPKQRVLRRK